MIENGLAFLFLWNEFVSVKCLDCYYSTLQPDLLIGSHFFQTGGVLESIFWPALMAFFPSLPFLPLQGTHSTMRPSV